MEIWDELAETWRFLACFVDSSSEESSKTMISGVGRFATLAYAAAALRSSSASESSSSSLSSSVSFGRPGSGLT